MSLTLLLRCNDLHATRHFYRSVLGFEVRDTVEGTLTVEKFGATMVFTSQDLWHGAPGCTGTIYFETPDIDAYYASVRDQVAVSWPLQVMSYGSREFGVVECNGYMLAFKQRQ